MKRIKETGRRRWALVGVAAVTLSVLVGGGLSLADSFAAPETPTFKSSEWSSLGDVTDLTERAQGRTLGDPGAPVTIYVFTDFQCPACRSFDALVIPELEVTYIETAIASLILYDFPLTGTHENAVLASRAAHCAGDNGIYWTYYDALFQGQGSWSSEQDPTSTFVSYAKDLGIDKREFEDCLSGGTHSTRVDENIALGRALGVASTPAVIVSSASETLLLKSVSFPAIREAIEDLAAGR